MHLLYESVKKVLPCRVDTMKTPAWWNIEAAQLDT